MTASAFLRTERLAIRELDPVGDAGFVFRLLNSPKFLKYIGDRGVRSVEEAAIFIESRYRQSYIDHGFGLYAVTLASDGKPIGICGFVNRDHLPAPDIGFAFLPEFERSGYGYESARGILDFGWNSLGFDRVLAIVSPGNIASESLLLKLGFMPNGPLDIAGDRVDLFSIERASGQ